MAVNFAAQYVMCLGLHYLPLNRNTKFIKFPNQLYRSGQVGSQIYTSAAGRIGSVISRVGSGQKVTHVQLWTSHASSVPTTGYRVHVMWCFDYFDTSTTNSTGRCAMTLVISFITLIRCTMTAVPYLL